MYDKLRNPGPRPVGAQIRRLREKRGLTLSELAERIGTSAPTAHRYESGWERFRLPTLRKIASALDARLEVRLVEMREDGSETPGTPEELVRVLRPAFWDKRLEASYLEEYPRWVLQRVLMFGTKEQVSAARSFYGDDAIRDVLTRRGTDARTRNYWEVILG